MPLRLGSTAFDNLYIGSTPITAVYLGSEQIWPEGGRISAGFVFTGALAPKLTASSSITASVVFTGTVSVGVRVVGNVAFTHSVTPRATLKAALSGALTFNGVVETDGFSLGFDAGYS